MTMSKREPVTIEQALVEGDLSGLDTEQRVAYYLRVCESLGLNPFTKPFDYLKLNGRLILYARKDATDQLRKSHRVSITKLERERMGELLVVTATATAADGRSDSAIGAVPVGDLKGESLANALMKAETKAKRRVTLSLCGLGMTDESEVDSIPFAERVPVALPDAEFTPIKDAAPEDDRDLVRSGDDRVWKRWLELLSQAQGLGLKVQQLRLPIERQVLIDQGIELSDRIDARRKEGEAIGSR